MATQTASSSSSSSRKYDVFLSFCGVDTRKNFTDHLYTALKQKGIITFRDDEKLERGKYISEELLKAIEESDHAIIVLSKNYAFSRWCLIELAKVVECTKKTGLIVFPVFYHVDPSDVRNQTRTLGEAFTKHEKDPKVNINDVQEWKAALTKMGNTSGWHLHDGHESKVIEEMVGKILGNLNSTYSISHKDLVGINSRMDELVDLLGMGLNDVRFIGIWGMGGMGKTTLAKVVYDRFHDRFEGSSFLANVREESGKRGLVSLQKQLLSDFLIEMSIDFSDVQRGINVILKRLCHKKVLIILDDVDRPDQLEALVGEQSWFGQGSRIIITTRDQHLLIRHEVAKAQIYKVKELNNDESLKLFSQKAFKKDHPLVGYEELSQKFIYYAKGLPLALEVLGSFLRCRDLNLWESTLARYKENPPKDILDVLEISFDSLEEREKSIYLDIACFFNGKDRGYVTKLLQILYDKPDIDIDVLLKKSLITISRRYFEMHDLLQELGREIVRRESPQEVGKRSRLWHSEDVLRVLRENSGTKSVKGIFLWSPPEKEKHLNVKAFSNMTNLRLLKISNVHLPQGLNYLSSELRSIHWARYPLESMPTSFEPEKLVELIMRSSLIKQLWKGFKSCDELKYIDLSYSKNLIEMPNLSGVPNLEQLILQGCTKLHRIHESLGNLKRLIQLDLRDCKNLSSLPNGCYSSMSLKILNLSGCSKLDELPKNLGKIKGLEELDLSGTAITGLPSSVVHLKNLKVLSLSGCVGLSSKPFNKLTRFPLMQSRRSPDPMGMLERSLIGLCSLTHLNLGFCNVQTIPNVLGCLSSLKYLNLRGNNFVCLPESIIQLSNLRGLYMGGCTHLRMLPKLPLNIDYIEATKCTSLETLSLRPEYDFRPRFRLLNCDKLIKNQGYGDLVSTMLRSRIINPTQDYWRNRLEIPGSEIPKWFRYQNVGASVNLQVPSDLLCNKLMGIVVCGVFVFRRQHPLHQLHNQDHGHMIGPLGIYCYIGDNEYIASTYFFEEFGKIESDQLWLEYFPSPRYGVDLKEIFNKVKANRFSRIEVKFKPFGPGLKVTKCGAHLVFEQDIEDLINQTKAGSSSCIITPYDQDGFEDSEKDAKIKRSRDDSDGEGAGPGGEATSNDVDEPHPKRIRLPNLIERLFPRLGNWLGNSSTQEQGDSDCEEEKSQ